jgi:plastocyanin
MKRWLTLCACLALCGAAAGCGDGDGDGKSAAATATAAEQPEAQGASTTETVTENEHRSVAGKHHRARAKKKHARPTKLVPNVAVSIEPDAFRPRSVRIAKGGTVTWTNHGERACDVTKVSGPGADFKSGKPGSLHARARWYTALDTRGKIAYTCRAHPSMVGTITVE